MYSSYSLYVQTTSEAHIASYPEIQRVRGGGVLFPGIKWDGGVMMTTYPI
jgi:hypothetical protein